MDRNTTDDSIVLVSDSRIAAIPVGESDEQLIDLRTVPELCVDSRYAGAGRAFAHLREGIVVRLLDAQSRLPHGLQFLITEGYRPLDRQRSIFDGYHAELRRKHPEWADERLYAETSKFVSPVSVAPHSTGGAVDLTLATLDGEEIDMGTAVDATPDATENACYTDSRGVPERAQRNRRIMASALTRSGLVNYPTEWWHWSFGDRYWAFVTGAGKSTYGPIHLATADINGNCS